MKAVLVNHTKTIMKAIEELGHTFNLEVITSDLDSLEKTVNNESPEAVILNWAEGMALETCSSIKNQREEREHIPYTYRYKRHSP